MFNEERLNAFHLQSGTRQGSPLSSVLLSIARETLTKAINEVKEIKVFQNRKEDIKQSQFTSDMGCI